MEDYLLIIEGVADERFITQYVSHISSGNISLTKENFLRVDTNLEGFINNSIFQPQVQKAIDSGKSVICILDADFEYEHRANKLATMVDNKSISDFFLLPFNRGREEKDHYSGVFNLETLLINLCHENHQDINQCHDQYVQCLQGTGKQLQLPNEKIKLYAYSTLLNVRTDGNIDPAKEKHRNYLDKTQWNLDQEALIPLKEFLLKHLSA